MITTDTLFNLMMFIRIHVQCICTHNLIVCTGMLAHQNQ